MAIEFGDIIRCNNVLFETIDTLIMVIGEAYFHVHWAPKSIVAKKGLILSIFTCKNLISSIFTFFDNFYVEEEYRIWKRSDKTSFWLFICAYFASNPFLLQNSPQQCLFDVNWSEYATYLLYKKNNNLRSNISFSCHNLRSLIPIFKTS